MVAAEQDQVVEFGLPATGPVDDVMRIDPAAILTAGKAAASFVAEVQRPAHRGRDRPGLAAYVELSLRSMKHRDERGIAGDSPGRLGADRRALVKSAAGLLGFAGQRRGVGVDDHLVALARGTWGGIAGEKELCDLQQSIGAVDTNWLRGTALRGHRVSLFALTNLLSRHLDRLEEERPIFRGEPGAHAEAAVFVPFTGEEAIAVARE